MSITFYEDVRVLEKDRNKKKKMLNAFHAKKPRLATIYCVTDNEADTLELTPAWNLLQPEYPAVRVLGLAENRNDGLDLLTQIIEEMYAQTGKLSPRTYFPS